jgi:hypothetical protein
MFLPVFNWRSHKSAISYILQGVSVEASSSIASLFSCGVYQTAQQNIPEIYIFCVQNRIIPQIYWYYSSEMFVRTRRIIFIYFTVHSLIQNQQNCGVLGYMWNSTHQRNFNESSSLGHSSLTSQTKVNSKKNYHDLNVTVRPEWMHVHLSSFVYLISSSYVQ